MERLADDGTLVHPDDACPACGGRDPDVLVWQGDDGDTLKCATCGTVYRPPSAGTPPADPG